MPLENEDAYFVWGNDKSHKSFVDGVCEYKHKNSLVWKDPRQHREPTLA